MIIPDDDWAILWVLLTDHINAMLGEWQMQQSPAEAERFEMIRRDFTIFRDRLLAHHRLQNM